MVDREQPPFHAVLGGDSPKKLGVVPKHPRLQSTLCAMGKGPRAFLPRELSIVRRLDTKVFPELTNFPDHRPAEGSKKHRDWMDVRGGVDFGTRADYFRSE